VLVVPHSHWGSNIGLQCSYECFGLNVSGVLGSTSARRVRGPHFQQRTLGSSLGSNWVNKYPPYQLVNLSSVNRHIQVPPRIGAVTKVCNVFMSALDSMLVEFWAPRRQDWSEDQIFGKMDPRIFPRVKLGKQVPTLSIS
jgi:hypothetical protein